MNVKTFYECQCCGKEYVDHYDATYCCEPKEIYRCGECNEYHAGDDQTAESCCNTNENESLTEQLEL